ncbi:MAG: magnesium and cobalt transport protein CorA [Gammaproteobacteria bacterium]|jgi:magnesium transporter|nr:magnesium and cobalt transport protein CorA [Gammaproteobacteria bacterium]
MTVIAARLYRDGRIVQDIAIDQPLPRVPAGSEFYWIGLCEPDAAELAALQRSFDLHPLAIEDARKAHQMPKLDVYGDQLFLVARTVALTGSEIGYGETSFFVGRHHIISVRHGSGRAHTELRTELESSPSLMRHGVDYVLHAILDYIVDGYLPVIEGVEDLVQSMEHRALDTCLRRDDVRALFHLRRQLGRFQRMMSQTGEVCSKLAHLELPHIDAEVRPYFRDVLDHVRRVESRVTGLREVLTTVFEVSMLLEQQQQGEITRRLAAWAAILAVPTAIAGIYGMNFEYMPELKMHSAYFVVLVSIVTICGVLYARFRRAGWL